MVVQISQVSYKLLSVGFRVSFWGELLIARLKKQALNGEIVILRYENVRVAHKPSHDSGLTNNSLMTNKILHLA